MIQSKIVNIEMKIKCNCKIHVKPEKLRCERGSFMYSISFEIYTMKKKPRNIQIFFMESNTTNKKCKLKAKFWRNINIVLHTYFVIL